VQGVCVGGCERERECVGVVACVSLDRNGVPMLLLILKWS